MASGQDVYKQQNGKTVLINLIIAILHDLIKSVIPQNKSFKTKIGGDLKIENRIGEERKNNFGTTMKIINYRNCDDIVVEFQDQYKYKKNTTYANFRRGQVKNPYDKTACGVGCVGEGKYLTKENGRSTKLYSCWKPFLCEWAE